MKDSLKPPGPLGFVNKVANRANRVATAPSFSEKEPETCFYTADPEVCVRVKSDRFLAFRNKGEDHRECVNTTALKDLFYSTSVANSGLQPTGGGGLQIADPDQLRFKFRTRVHNYFKTNLRGADMWTTGEWR